MRPLLLRRPAWWLRPGLVVRAALRRRAAPVSPPVPPPHHLPPLVRARLRQLVRPPRAALAVLQLWLGLYGLAQVAGIALGQYGMLRQTLEVHDAVLAAQLGLGLCALGQMGTCLSRRAGLRVAVNVMESCCWLAYVWLLLVERTLITPLWSGLVSLSGNLYLVHQLARFGASDEGA